MKRKENSRFSSLGLCHRAIILSSFHIHRLEEVPECDRHFSFCLSSVGETTQSFPLCERPPGAVLWVADTIQPPQKEFCMSEAKEEREKRRMNCWGTLERNGERRGLLKES
ncbi:hypothetical protein ILYODFUR_000440 [Ilyodon furcidens]|uniref:Uncharacterized protein n=1 Tax=Ilyodon furcidens TaxID=33524 RepID=A0ABV0UPB3_9TELE